MAEQTIHAAFIAGKLTNVAIVEGDVSEVARRTMLQVRSFGHHVESAGGTYDIDGCATELVYDVTVKLADNGAPVPWRHHFRRPDAAWKMADRSELVDTIGGRP